MLRSPLREVQVGQGHPAISSPDIKEHDRQQQRYERLVSQGKDLAMKGNVKEALQLYQQAQKLQPSDKLERRIARMEEYLKEYGDGEEEEEEDGGDEMAHLGDGFYLYVDLYKQLYSHQREGIRWMWSLYRKKKGGILGDDMGLGKTIQVIAFLAGMFDAQKVHSVLIVLPPAVMVNWEKEFEKWAPGIRVLAFHGGSKKDRERVLNKIHRKGGVCMTTYGMLVNNAPQLAEREGREYVWDYIILDEGHKIKNPSIKCSKGVHAIAARHRLILTGTPIQNNLKEMWALFNWTHQGTLLGTAKTFAMEYEGPITRARQKDATAGEQRLGSEIANSLQKIINPFFLRRTKASVAKKEKENRKDKTDGEEAEPSNDKKAPSMPTLSRKNDLIVWTHLSEAQQQIYQDFLDTPDVAMLLNTSKSPLTGLMVLKKICDHPRLLTTVQCHQLGIEIPDSDTIAHEDSEQGRQCAASHIHGISNNMLMGESGKLQFLVLLLNNLRDTGHRCLVFSQSRKMLDIIQKILREKGHKVARLDGTIRHLQEREQIISKFTKDKSYNVFLLTTQVGGVGLTLTAADRVVIFDPSWNPATDAQAVDRAFRIGQQKNVVIYRLITCGTVEEKIYRRQIFKDSITKQTTGDSKNPYRYFSRQELHELFVLDNPRHSTTQEQLNSLYEGKRHTDISLDEHIAFLHSLDIFGLSDHDLMFSQEAVQDSDEEPENGEYISQRVNRAQTLISMESDNNMASTDSNGRFQAPEVFREPKENRPPRTQNWQPPALGGPSPGTLIDLTAAESHSAPASPESSHHDSEEEEEVESEEEEMEQGSPVKNAPRPTVVTSPEKLADLSVALHDLTIEEDESEEGDQDESQIRSPTPPPGVQAPKHSFENKQHEETEEFMDSGNRSQDEYADTVGESPSSYRPQQNLNGSMQIPDSPVNTDDENMDIPGSPVNKKAKQTPKHETPKSGQASMKKKRRSVCVTPGRANVFMSDPAAVMSPAAGPVVEESIVLSPEAYDPLVKTLPVVVSTSSLAGYESFIKPLGGAANSTVLDRPSPMDHDKHSLSFVEETPETSLVDSPGPSMMKTKRAMVIRESDDDEDESDNKPYQPIDVSDYLSESEEEGTTDSSGNNQEDAEGVMETDEEHDITENGNNLRSSMQKSEQKSITRNNDSLRNSSSRELTSHQNSDRSDKRSAKTSLPVVSNSDTEEMEDDEAEEDAEQVDEDEVEEEEVEEEESEEEEAEEDGEDEEESEEEDEEELTQEEQDRYIHLMKKSRTLAKSNQFLEALQFCLEALGIYNGDERARAYAVKLQRKLQM